MHPILSSDSGTQFPLEGRSGKYVPLWGSILGHSFRLRPPPESASHSEARFRDAVSACGGAPNKGPRLAMEPGPKAQRM